MFKCDIKREHDHETFYRYCLDDNKVWFTQSVSGNIYNVYVSLNKQLEEMLELYVHIRETEEYTYYPDYNYIQLKTNRLYMEHNIDEYIEKLQYAKLIKEEIMKIFELEEHKSKECRIE